ncbi:molybdenum cofactor guanylyltransferase [Pseudoalteromonas shioyasakiensis]|uniref:molybdenum cofactor guanylyltransferase n=1 Tax=Pseudoalteromonas shioyasakiensis TaxID=1190813 RepID=UPI00211918D9|nr:molybdenum cofactor guanylyltransferase [Pseudoalteromonas shioyasakiensis]MCQ8878774.1 molybdenum cofactor guanylyltransferase [Pseudoalteromonas shioyasakiensis]
MSFTAVVLAGGLSSRMGTDKAQLQLEQKTFLARAIELVELAGCDRVIVSSNKPGYLADVYPGNGPLGGVYTALMNTSQDILTVAVDMPLITEEILINLCDKGKCDKVTATFYHDNPLPMFIKNSTAVKATLKEILLQPESNKSIKNFLKIIAASELKKPCVGEFININTPDEFLALT